MDQLQRLIDNITKQIPTSVIQNTRESTLEIVKNSPCVAWEFSSDFCGADETGKMLDVTLNGPDGISFNFSLARGWPLVPVNVELETSWTLARKGWELARLSPPDGNVKFFPNFSGEEISLALQQLLQRITDDTDFSKASLPRGKRLNEK